MPSAGPMTVASIIGCFHASQRRCQVFVRTMALQPYGINRGRSNPKVRSCPRCRSSAACLSAVGQSRMGSPADCRRTRVAFFSTPISISALVLPVGSSPAVKQCSRSLAVVHSRNLFETNSFARSAEYRILQTISMSLQSPSPPCDSTGVLLM